MFATVVAYHSFPRRGLMPLALGREQGLDLTVLAPSGSFIVTAEPMPAHSSVAAACRQLSRGTMHPFHCIGCRERKIAGQHFVQRDSKGVKVASGRG